MGPKLTAIEFFAGIGAFAEACRFSTIEVVRAFDQNEHANKVYESNFGLSPVGLNLASISSTEIPDADIWWMSPPCTPFSRRGKQMDDEDPRAEPLLRLIEILKSKKPSYFFLENVEGFANSRVNDRLQETLSSLGYKQRSLNLCSSNLGVPMRRPRHFIAASLQGEPGEPVMERFRDRRSLSEYLSADDDEKLLLAEAEIEKYRAVLNIVDPKDRDSYLICFTRGYHKCRTASGSLLQLPSGRVRFVSPSEILNLLGFSSNYCFPESLSLPLQWRLVGNSVDVRAVKTLLATAGL